MAPKAGSEELTSPTTYLPLFSSTISVLQPQTFLSHFMFFIFICKREAGKMVLQRGVAAVIALMLTCVTICGSAPSPPPAPGAYVPSGRDKDAWPELLRMNADDAVAALAASGLVQNIYVQPPSFGLGPANIGLSSDVWVYTDGSVVYETPQRGVWHANRLIPGWPEVTGMPYKSAIAKIKADYLGVTVIYGAKGSFVRTTTIKMDRVFMEINNNSMVVGVPYIG